MVRQYIGARYVPKFYENSLNPLSNEWEQNVTYEALTVVTYLSDSYTSKKPVPITVGNPRDNSEYWCLTGAYNAQIEQYRSDVENLSNKVGDLDDLETSEKETIVAAINSLLDESNNIIINAVDDLGCDNTGTNDNLSILNNFLIDQHTNNKSTKLYFPKGKYNISNCLALPDNTEIFGDGEETEIYMTISGNNSGQVIITAGSNIKIHDLKGNYLGGNFAVIKPAGSMMGFIGIGTFIYEEAVQDVFTTTENVKNIFIDNIYTDCNYAIQCENTSAGTATIENVIYRNVYAPRACVSVEPQRAHSIKKVLLDNIICSVVRLARGYTVDDLKVNNVYTNFIAINSDAQLDNLVVDCDENSNAFTSPNFINYYGNAAIATGDFKIQIGNLDVRQSENVTYSIYNTYGTNIQVANMLIDDTSGMRKVRGTKICIANLKLLNESFTYASGVGATSYAYTGLSREGNTQKLVISAVSTSNMSDILTIGGYNALPDFDIKQPVMIQTASSSCFIGYVTVTTAGAVSVTCPDTSEIRKVVGTIEWRIN